MDFKKLNFLIDKKDLKVLEKETKNIVSKIKNAAKKEKIKADVFVGGSFAKGTLVKNDKYEIDIFVRFDRKYEDISDILEKIVKNAVREMRKGIKKIHGSRDYFQIDYNNMILFEIIPVIKIKSAKESQNVTDLSYFHVNYVKRNLRKNLAKEISLAKSFAKAHNVYGAESYIHGLSGYAIECLIIYYKSFKKMAKILSEANEQIIIDPKKWYKNKKDIELSVNESRLKSPVVLIDPTWKERNVLAALSNESFEKFKEGLKKYMKKPSEKMFYPKKLDIEQIKRYARENNAEFIEIIIETDKQEGDIAGTKLKKFSLFIEKNIDKYFNILRTEFIYNEEKKARFYIVGKSKREIIEKGPPINMIEHVKVFRKKHKNVFEKDGNLYTKIKVDFSIKEYIEDFAIKKDKTLREMDITSVIVI